MAEEKKSLKSSFSELLISRILSGALSPGEKLPPERTLAKDYKMSRGSVNQGILDLARIGFLRIVPRHGTYVADYLQEATPEVTAAIMNYDSALIDPALFRDLMSFRILIECECASLSAERIGQESRNELNRLTNRIFSAGYEKAADVLFEYHIFIVRLSGNRAYLMFFRSFEKMIRKLIAAHYASSETEIGKMLPLYNDLTCAISHGSSADARDIMRQILGYAAAYLNEMLK